MQTNQSFCDENNFRSTTSDLLCPLQFLFSQVTEGKKSFCTYPCRRSDFTSVKVTGCGVRRRIRF